MKIYIETLGCPKNETDSLQLEGLLEDHGHRVVGEPDDAEVFVVNTCGFINDAKKESIDQILAFAAYKTGKEILVVTGCLSQRYGEDLTKAIPEIDILLGVNDYQALPQMLQEYEKGKVNVACHPAPSEYSEWGHRTNSSPGYSAYLKIAEGCNNTCAYCVIPSIRGPYLSRKKENILEEAGDLAAKGCKELILVAQDVTAYGQDLYGEYSLTGLLEALCQIDGIRWIRLMYCYEDRITEELISVMAREEKICHYIDIPLQHVSDRVLRSMNRRSTNASIRNTIECLRRAMPDIVIRSTLITGFPGETKEEFEEMLAFVKEMELERLGVFAYSKEEGTPAALMKEQVHPRTKNARRDRIMEAQRLISLKNNQKKIGATLEILVETREEDGTYIGRSRYDAPDIDFSVLFTAANEELEAGDLVDVKITDAFDYDLTGEFVKHTERK